MAKYILCRPEGGLNDTLTQIEAACLYGYKTQRIIVVDTAHPSSKHFRDDFSYYFTSIDPNLYLNVDQFSTAFDNTTVYPAFLSGRVSNYDIEIVPNNPLWLETRFKLPIVVDYGRDYSETLVVHQHFGGGSISLDTLRRLRLKSWLVDALHDRLQRIGDSYSAIHIRNSDIQTDYESVIAELKNVSSLFSKLFVATDSKIVLDSFKREFGDRIISFTHLPDSTAPLHYLASDPRQCNTDAILDLLTLACSDQYMMTELSNCNFAKISGYSLLAYNLHKNKTVLQNLINDDRIKIKT